MPDEMAEAHARDYREKARIDTLRTAIQDYLDEPTHPRAHLLDELRVILKDLERESARIVQRWN